ncbi:histidinol-phosphatase [soil metagenome]
MPKTAWTNYHSHTRFCDGTNEPEAYAIAALEQGVAIYGFSTHSPIPFSNGWSMKAESVPEYISLVNALKEAYAGKLEIYLSMEVDFVPDLTGVNDPAISSLGLDYTVGSVHYVEQFADGAHFEIDYTHSYFDKGLQEIFHGDVQKCVTRYYEITRQMLTEAKPDILGHLDKIKMHNKAQPHFAETELWYRDAIMETLELTAKTGVIMEVNTRGMYKKLSDEPYPSAWILKEAKTLGIPVMINSDSHVPREITGEFEAAAQMVLNAGYKEVRIFKDYTWQDKPLTPNGIIL